MGGVEAYLAYAYAVVVIAFFISQYRLWHWCPESLYTLANCERNTVCLLYGDRFELYGMTASENPYCSSAGGISEYLGWSGERSASVQPSGEDQLL